MIEVSSWPEDLSTWKASDHPFYLEFFGETAPLLDEHYAEVVKAGCDQAASQSDVPVYEYWWTLGHPGSIEHHAHWPLSDSGAKKAWDDLADPAVRVYLYFPISCGWRIKELIATLKYLSPMPEEHGWLEQAGKDFQSLQPWLAGGSQIAGLVPGGGTASKWLETIAKLKVSSVPQSGDFNWSVGKVTFGSEHGVMQGVMWILPRTVFQRLGGRLTGSLALSFIPANRQVSPEAELSAGNALAHAAIYGASETYWVPAEPADGHGFVELRISPTKGPDSERSA